MKGNMELLGVLWKDDLELAHVMLETNTSAALRQRYEILGTEFLKDRKRISYTPGYTCESDELMVLDYELPATFRGIKHALPSNIPHLTRDELKTGNLAALVAVYLYPSSTPLFLFQAIAKNNILQPQTAILFGQHTHAISNKEVVVVPRDSIDAIYQAGQLLFRSEHQVRRFLDFSIHFHEATDQEIESFFSNPIFAVEDINAVKGAATTLMRRRIAQLASKQENIDLKRVREAANRANILLATNNGAIVVPGTREDLRNLVDLLNDCYVSSLLNEDSLYYSNSKRPLARRT